MSIEIERLAKLEEKVDNGFTEIRGDLTEIKETLKNLDNRYASKLVEKIVYGMAALILVGWFYTVSH